MLRYSEEFKKGIVYLCTNGYTMRSLSHSFRISVSSILNWRKDYKDTVNPGKELLYDFEAMNHRAEALTYAEEDMITHLNEKK